MRHLSTTDAYCAGFAMVMGHQPIAVYTLPPRPQRMGPAKVPVVFEFAPEAAETLRAYWTGDEMANSVRPPPTRSKSTPASLRQGTPACK